MLKITLKDGYSDRQGITRFKDIIQFKELNNRTRNKIYNLVVDAVKKLDAIHRHDSLPTLQVSFVKCLYENAFGCNNEDMPIETTQYGTPYVNLDCFNKQILDFIKSSTYSDIFNLIEMIVRIGMINKKVFQEEINKIFTDENVQHRLINDQITDLTNQEEIESVQSALDVKDEISNHFEKAMQLLYSRDNPDYANSVKESILAMEGYFNKVAGEKGTLGATIKKLDDKGINVHPALKEAISKLYGYSSDAEGIRHAGNGAATTTESEARLIFMMCIALYNYFRMELE